MNVAKNIDSDTDPICKHSVSVLQPDLYSMQIPHQSRHRQSTEDVCLSI